MFPSENFYAQLRRHEGFYAAPYVCPAGKATIGYGTNLEAHTAYIPYADLREKAERGLLGGKALVEMLKSRGMSWSRADAEEAMRAEVNLCVHQLEKRCEAYGRLVARDETVRAEAIINMCFNIGIGCAPYGGNAGRGLLSFVNTLSLIESGQYAAAADNMLKSRWAAQVKGRAVQLASQMRSGEYEGVA